MSDDCKIKYTNIVDDIRYVDKVYTYNIITNDEYIYLYYLNIISKPFLVFKYFLKSKMFNSLFRNDTTKKT